jgi:hypothetical protein
VLCDMKGPADWLRFYERTHWRSNARFKCADNLTQCI